MASAADSNLTPMMQQYRRAKAELAADVLLLFRMGDFYEMFFDDATRGSKLFEITLTRRNGIPMAGIPYHALQSYLPRVLEAGIKVAIAEQVEDPKLAKGLVKREITQIITPGTVVDSMALKAGRSNFIVSLCRGRGQLHGVASLDISTGDFRLTQVETMQVNSAHHQAVKSVPANIVIDAVAPDGVIEGIEDPSRKFCIGVQWHPEFHISPADVRLFSAFVDACR